MITYIKELLSAPKETKDNLSMRLVRAAEAGDIAAVKKSLKEGAKIDGRDTNGDTALIGAAREHQTEMVSFLLSKGADVSLANNFNKTALHTALFDHAPEALCKKLIKPGLDYSGLDMHGNPAVFYTAQYGQIEVLEALAAAGADLAQKGRGGTTPLMQALNVGQSEAAFRLLGDELVSRAGIDAQDDMGSTALAIAANLGREKLALKLIALGANVETKDNEGRTAAAIAAERGYAAITDAIEEERARKYAVIADAPVRTMRAISLRTGAMP